MIDLSEIARRRVAVENGALPGSARLYVPREGEQVRDKAGAIWSVAIVKARMSEAATVIEKTTRRDGPRAKLTSWPVAEGDDEWMRQWASLRDGGEQARASYARQRNRVPFRATAAQMTRAEQAIGWPARYLAADDCEWPRRWLQLWLYSEATGMGWEDLIERARALEVEHASIRTARRRRGDAFEIILAGLIKDGIAP